MSKTHFVLGTAGHIDHGKTALVKALTGIDADRLKEEKQRGITIELGFAHMDTEPSRVSIVDVPGHERFVRAMTAGATGVDAVMLVVAADEGVMPQTREHLAICSLLGLNAGFVAVTKVDLVDDEWLELVRDDINGFIEGSFLEGCPVIPCSAQNGSGIDEINAAVARLADQLSGRPANGILRIPLDRVFTMHGFGTVVTGTIIAGTVRTGEEVVFLPSNVKARVRGLQVHSDSVEEATAGKRLAVNLKGMDKDQLERGEVLAREGTITPTVRFDAMTTHLSWNRHPIKRRKPSLLLCGTTVRQASAVPLQAETLEPGQTGMVQFHLRRPVALLPGDRFILQGFDLNPQHGATVGGGIVIRTHPPRRRRPDEEYAAFLEKLSKADPEQRLEMEIESQGFNGIEEARLAESVPYLPAETRKTLERLLTKKKVLLFDKERRGVAHGAELERLKRRIVAEVERLTEGSPMAAGFPRQEVYSRLPGNIPSRLYRLAVDQLVADETLISDQENVALASARHAVEQQELAEQALMIFQRARLQPPKLSEVAARLDASERDLKDVINTLVRDGRLVRARDNLWFHPEHIQNLKMRLIAFFNDHEEITPLEFKEMCGVSRKYFIPLAELFDQQQVTIRTGDVRRLRKK